MLLLALYASINIAKYVFNVFTDVIQKEKNKASVGEEIQRKNFPTEEASDNACSVLLDFQGKQVHVEFKKLTLSFSINTKHFFYLEGTLPLNVGKFKYSQLPIFSDENSNQSSLSDLYQPKAAADSSSYSSPQPSEPVSPAAQTLDYHTDDPQPPTLGQESMEGEAHTYTFIL